MTFGPSKTYLQTSDESARSEAEEMLQLRLHWLGFNKGLVTNKKTVFSEEERKLFPEDDDQFAIPDFWWQEYDLIIEIDGPHHLKAKQSLRDRRVDVTLRNRGITVQRFTHGYDEWEITIYSEYMDVILNYIIRSLREKGYEPYPRTERTISPL